MHGASKIRFHDALSCLGWQKESIALGLARLVQSWILGNLLQCPISCTKVSVSPFCLRFLPKFASPSALPEGISGKSKERLSERSWHPPFNSAGQWPAVDPIFV